MFSTTASNSKADGKPVTWKPMSEGEPSTAGGSAYESELRSFTEDKSKSQERSLIRKHNYNEKAHPSRKANSDFDLPTAIDFEDAESESKIPSKDAIYNLTDVRGERESTITPSERHAFQKIFADIFQRNAQPTPESKLLDWDESAITASGEVKSWKVKPRITDEQRQRAKLNLADLMSKAVITEESKSEAVNRYPAALRPAAARAIGLDMDSIKKGGFPDEKEAVAATESKEVEALRESERIRVEGLMKAAKTDFELWDIMEKEVFSLIAKMGLGELPTTVKETAPPAPKKRGRKPKKDFKKAEAKADITKTPEVSPSGVQDDVGGVPPLSLYGPLYPSFVLFGLRLFDRSFARSSPLALSILPRIKSMGFISHVLGASTSFYNELIRIYRYRHDDFLGILNLLSEMENAALEMDEETYEIVHDIVATQQAVRRGEKGGTIKALWKLPEFGFGKFNDWDNKLGSEAEQNV